MDAVRQVRLSPSRVSDYMNCPQLYKFRAIDQLPEAISLAAERGTLVHSVLENLFDTPAPNRNLEKALEILPSLWGEQLDSRPELQEVVTNEKEWLDRASALLSTYFTLESPETFEPTHRELHVEIDLTELIYLHGYIDRLDIAPTGEVRIVDYKTGKSPRPGWEEKALFQLWIYALIYWRTSGSIPTLVQLIYLGDGQLLRNSPSEVELLRTEEKLLRIAEQLLKSIENNLWPTRKSRLCDWCSFKPICPAFS
jgi:putative RecB family exonuclease